MSKRPFAGIEQVEIGMPRDPFLEPKNVRRDLSQPPDRNMIASDPASYVVEILGCEYKGTRKSGDQFKVTMKIAASDGGPNAIGSKAVWMCGERSEYFQRDVKRFACAAMNAPPTAFRESDFEAMVSTGQPITAAHRFVLVEVQNSKGKQPPHKDFTAHVWKPIERLADGSFAPPAVDNTLPPKVAA